MGDTRKFQELINLWPSYSILNKLETLSRYNWNLEMLVFEEREKLVYYKKSLFKQRRQPTTNTTQIIMGSIGGTLSALTPI